jgi:hypothetical protein
MFLNRLSKIRGPGLRTPCGEGWRRRAAEQNFVKPTLRGRAEAGFGLLQAGGASDDGGDFGQ